MQEFLRQEQIELLRASEIGYDGREKASEKEERRMQIKRGKQENKRLHREWAEMKKEDARSAAVSKLSDALGRNLEGISNSIVMTMLKRNENASKRKKGWPPKRWAIVIPS